MFVIPAIDLKGGKCVRLLQGDPDKETVYNDDPIEQAKAFKDAGVELVHVVDLDGAFEGSTANYTIIEKIVNNVNIKIEVGGGIRSKEVIENYNSIGVKRLIVGTFSLKKEFEEVAREYSDILIVGIDAKNGFVATHGWKKVTETKAFEFAGRMQELGINKFIYTDIATDGMLTGPNFEEVSTLVTHCPGAEIIASGGVSTIDDIRKLKAIEGVAGCIVGKAIYDGKVDIKEALSV